MFANTIEDVSRLQYKALFDATERLSAVMTNEAAVGNMTFPFVTIPHWEFFARDARVSAKAELMTYSARVTAEQVPAFNAYIAQGHAQEWIMTSRHINNQMDRTPHHQDYDDAVYSYAL